MSKVAWLPCFNPEATTDSGSAGIIMTMEEKVLPAAIHFMCNENEMHFHYKSRN
jgi:hypothetical protein